MKEGSEAPGHKPAAVMVAGGQGRRLAILMIVWFASGFAALVYQVLWVRGLGLLFGSTAQAAAITIAVFFAGMMSGGWFWGRRSPREDRPLRTFGIVEIGVAIAALGHFILLDVYLALYPSLFALVGDSRGVATVAKALVAATILFPPAFLMGGTLPLMGQHLIRNRDQLGRTGSTLYAINTAGGASGALAAGFLLPPLLGFNGAYMLAVAVDVIVGGTALLLARRAPVRTDVNDGAAPVAVSRSETRRSGRGRGRARDRLEQEKVGASVGLSAGVIWIVAFGSGVATLAIEVIWTRLFSQVLQNSAYTYSLVLTTFLVALALGSTAANALNRLRQPGPVALLSILLAGSALVAVATPWMFTSLTDGLSYVGGTHGWSAYVIDVILLAAKVMLGPGIVLGAVLPYLLRALPGDTHAPGEAIGRLVAANTGGAVVGSLAAGFVLLPTFGVSRSLALVAALYLALTAVIAAKGLSRYRMPAMVASWAGVFALLLFQPRPMQSVTLNPEAGDRLLELREGMSAHVAVVERDDDLSIRVNNYYTLGGTATLEFERNQAIVPMLVHPDASSVFFLGMGTGLSAGASLFFPVDRVVVCELLPEVVDLSREYFQPWLMGLFQDSRVTIHAEDGRNCLRRSRDSYDLIISDLFTPWHAGTGNLYTVEHYRDAKERLAPGGAYVQWVALYQVTELELGIIARTMQEVFPQVVVWRGDLTHDRSIVALVGQVEPAVLDPDVIVQNVRIISEQPSMPAEDAEKLVLRFYAGNVTQGKPFGDGPINTDDRPVIEYLAPRSYRAVVAGEAEWLVGEGRDELYTKLLGAAPLESDPYLERLEPEQLNYIREGLVESYSGRPAPAQAR